MALTVIGKIQEIGNIESIPYANKVFQKRTLVLDASRFNPLTGEQYENYPKFEVSGSHVNDLNNFQVGQLVTVTFALNGRKTEKDGQVSYFTNIQAYKIEPYRSQNGSQGGSPSQQVEQAQQMAATSAATTPQPFPPTCDESGRPIDNNDLPF